MRRLGGRGDWRPHQARAFCGVQSHVVVPLPKPGLGSYLMHHQRELFPHLCGDLIVGTGVAVMLIRRAVERLYITGTRQGESRVGCL